MRLLRLRLLRRREHPAQSVGRGRVDGVGGEAGGEPRRQSAAEAMEADEQVLLFVLMGCVMNWAGG